jgi:hypothetical protein
MVVGFRSDPKSGRRWPFYRCPPVGDCQRRVTVSAEIAESTIVAAVKELLAGVTGTATADSGVAGLRREVDQIEAELDAAVRAFDGLQDVDAVRERLTELRDARDGARERLAVAEDIALPAITVTAADWDALTREEQRALIRATVAAALVAPGSARDRITVEPFAQ